MKLEFTKTFSATISLEPTIKTEKSENFLRNICEFIIMIKNMSFVKKKAESLYKCIINGERFRSRC